MTPTRRFASITLLSFSLAWSAAGSAAVNLVVSDQQTSDHPVVRTLEFFGQRLTQATRGDLTITVKANGSAGSEHDAILALQNGTQALARLNLGALSEQSSAATLASLPYLFRSSDHMGKVLKGDFGQRLDQELEQKGLIRLAYFESAPRNFYCMKPIRSQADFAGRKIRVLPSPVFEDLIRNLGGTPVPMSFNKIPEALRAGELDCVDGGTVNFVAAEHHKITPWLMQDEHLLLPEVLLISKKTWGTLSTAQQDAIRQSAQDASGHMTKLWTDQESAALTTAKKAGVTVVPRSQISMTGIESLAIKTYNKYIKNSQDLETIIRIMSVK
ncbi:TRAP transporter substrate-binding protein DctP [Uliginosibacterium sp. 31-12]|uniref:TRAP transporter substrate-binding protein DctP n=1 Tax=Uliginosibacterium sp. 31-12 TaxID=3062781 RepID=UPI0026E1250A|nr:TRAP transporter substrate-binding protein DctP [Uliginosibacterium sp. 31-12]MDO6387003.1 TRAP transporter substrate-binding protein DctP [Uliginosibacterium sp. 31-12]